MIQDAVVQRTLDAMLLTLGAIYTYVDQSSRSRAEKDWMLDVIEHLVREILVAQQRLEVVSSAGPVPGIYNLENEIPEA